MTKMKGIIKRIITLFTAFLLGMSSAMAVSASEAALMYSDFEENKLKLYFNLPHEKMHLEGAYIEGEKVDILKFKKFDKTTEIKTIFLADKSVISDKTKVFGSCLPIMQEFLLRSYENESFAVIAFGDAKVDDESFSESAKEILNSVDNLTYENSGRSNLYDAISYVNDKLSVENDDSFKKIVVLTDSETVNSVPEDDVTKENFVYPLYFILFDEEEEAVNENNLKGENFYSEYYRHKNETAVDAITDMISKRSNYYYCELEIPFHVLKIKGERLLTADFTTDSYTTSLMEIVNIEPSYEYVMNRESKNMRNIIIILVSSFIVIIAVVVIIARRSVLKKNHAFRQTETMLLPPDPEEDEDAEEGKTTYTIPTTKGTKVLFKENRYKIVLIDKEDPENVIEAVLQGELIVGRNRSVADCVVKNEQSISQKHCKIFLRDSKVYVSDLGSLNHTYVDEEEVVTETELLDGCSLKLGRIDFEVHVIVVRS